MTKITAEMVPPEDRPKRRLPRLSARPPNWTITASRAAFLVLAGLAAVAAPEPWMRAIPAIPIVIVCYVVGWFDGRRALALELIGGRRDDRGSRPAPPVGGEPEGD